MQPQELAYLARYAFALLAIFTAYFLIRSAIGDLRGRIRTNLRPVQGYFLMLLGDGKQIGGRSLPLFHTTVLGRGRSTDIRLESEDIARRHAMIYLHEGEWYIRPVHLHHRVLLNNIPVLDAVILRNQDIVTIGMVSMLFIDERASAAAQGLEYRPAPGQTALQAAAMVPTAASWFFTNIAIILSAFISAILAPEGYEVLREPILILFGVFFFIFNLYYFVLPFLLKPLDRPFFVAVMNLALLGLVIQTRLTMININYPPVTPELLEDIMSSLSVQAFALFLGLVLMPIIILVVQRTRFLERMVFVCGVITPLLLIATLVFGRGRQEMGATLWIVIGGFSFQLTEFAKITYLVVLAGFFKIRPPFRVQLGFAAWAATVFFLIMMLPDLGSVMILLPTTLIVFVVMTSEYLTTFLILLAGTAVSTAAFAFFPHVQRRISGWSTLWTEVNDLNRQIVYGLQAIGRGGFVGRGLGNGSPEGIPLAGSDMVFAVIGEEMGLLVLLSVMVFFIVLWLRGAKSTMMVRDGFSSSLTLGVASLFFMEAVVVIAGVTGLIPLTGATLPFIAAGGSSVLAKTILAAIYLGLAGRREGV